MRGEDDDEVPLGHKIKFYKIYPATALIIMVVTCIFLDPSSAAPTQTKSESNQNAAIAESWWFNSCGHHQLLHAEHKKHNRSDVKIFKIVRNQMKLTHNLFNKEFEHISKMYIGVQAFEKYERKSFDWLPEYKDTNKSRSKETLKEFHEQLQNYIVAINYLIKLKINTLVEFDRAKRNATLVTVFNQMKSLICEIEDGVNATGQTVTIRVRPDVPEKHGLKMEFDNITELYLVDTGVLNKLKKFIQKWYKNLMKRLPPIHKRESESAEFWNNYDTSENENENSVDIIQ